MPLFLNQSEQGFEIKKEVFLYDRDGGSKDYKEFNLGEDLSGESWDDFMSYARFVSYDGDLAILFDNLKKKQI